MAVLIQKNLRLPLKSHAELAAIKEANKLMTSAGMAETQQAAVRTAVIEAIINVVEHSQADQQGEFEIEFEISSTDLKIVVRDHGKGFRVNKISPVDVQKKRKLKETRGWGLHLIKETMDEVQIHSDGKGTTLTMIKKRKGTI